MLQDLIIAAVNQAIGKAQELQASDDARRSTGGLQHPRPLLARRTSATTIRSRG